MTRYGAVDKSAINNKNTEKRKSMKEYNSLDEIVQEVLGREVIEGVYANGIEEDVGLMREIIEFFTSNWSEKIVFVIAIAIAVLVPKFATIILPLALLIYLYIKGKRLSPGIVIVTNNKVYLVDDITHDRKSKKFTYESVNESNRDDIKKYFKLKHLNPLYHLFMQSFIMNNKKYTITRSPLLSIIFSGLYPTQNVVSFSKIKSLLHNRNIA